MPVTTAARRPRDDAASLAEQLNAFHRHDQFWRPQTAEGLRERLERAPNQYSWEHVLVDGSALLGVWPAGRSTRVITSGPTGRADHRQGVVLDYAFDADEPQVFMALVRAWCRRLADEGIDRMVFFTNEGSQLQAKLAPITVRTRRFDLWTTAVPQPPGSTAVHVDPVYF